MREFTAQRIHSSLQIGQRLVLADSKVPAFSYQGAWDGGCCLHVAAMALGMLGLLSQPLRVTSGRGHVESRFWRRAEQYYLSGISLDDLSTLLQELGVGVRPVLCEGSHAKVAGFCEQEVLRGWPTIVCWRERHRTQLHAVLAVGVEGRQTGRVFKPHTLLALDPAECEPSLSACNARLTWNAGGLRARDGYAAYETASYRRTVVLAGALSVRKRKPP